MHKMCQILHLQQNIVWSEEKLCLLQDYCTPAYVMYKGHIQQKMMRKNISYYNMINFLKSFIAHNNHCYLWPHLCCIVSHMYLSVDRPNTQDSRRRPFPPASSLGVCVLRSQ